VSRKSDIDEKLLYADRRFNDLAAALHAGGLAGSSIDFLSSIAGEIISACREPFDYCAHDIVEKFILINDPSLAALYHSGKLRCYFPFYKNQLVKAGSVFSKLKIHHKPLHNHLFSLAAAVEHKVIRQSTRLNYAALQEMCDMVNEKKHNRLIQIRAKASNTLFIKGRGVQMMMNLDEQRGYSKVELPAGTEHNVGEQYVFATNNKDVLEFSMNCRMLSRLVLNETYQRFL
jgi:hypothetical protein